MFHPSGILRENLWFPPFHSFNLFMVRFLREWRSTVEQHLNCSLSLSLCFSLFLFQLVLYWEGKGCLARRHTAPLALRKPSLTLTLAALPLAHQWLDKGPHLRTTVIRLWLQSIRRMRRSLLDCQRQSDERWATSVPCMHAPFITHTN